MSEWAEHRMRLLESLTSARRGADAACADGTPAGVRGLALQVRQAREELFAVGRTLTVLAAAYDQIPGTD